MREEQEAPCGCGCGGTVVFQRLQPSRLKYQGPIRYIKGHQHRHRIFTPEMRAKYSRPGRLNNHWKGGRMMDADGYVLIKQRDHPHANKAGYVREHRLVIENAIGRLLRRDEVVHHINEQKNDNRLENLQLLPTQSVHQTLGRIGKRYPRKTTRILHCETCGVEYHRRPSLGPSRFCSWACRYPKERVTAEPS